MFSQDDDNQGLVLGVVFGLIALVIALVIGLSIHKTRGARIAPPSAAAASAFSIGPTTTVAKSGAKAAQAVVVEGGIVKIYFYPGQTDLPIGASEALSTMAQEVVAGKSLVVSAWHDASGSASRNAELARQRAESVRNLLASLGVPPEKVELNKSSALNMAGLVNNAEARRVEVMAR